MAAVPTGTLMRQDATPNALMPHSWLHRASTLLGGLFGISVTAPLRRLRNAPAFIGSALAYRRAGRSSRFPLRARDLRPVLGDSDRAAGAVTDHYFWQDLWVAQRIFAVRPAAHVDVGSRLDGFVAHLLTFMPVTVIDIRPLPVVIPGLTFVREDATLMAGFDNDTVESLSSLHAVEHFGLGRYGDTIDPDACFKAMRSLVRVLKPGGRLYFSVPIGVERLEFNAHRVFAPQTILDAFRGLALCAFAAIDDRGQFLEDARPQGLGRARYACGIFEFTKPR